MRIIKIIGGIGCFVLALYFIFGVISFLLSDFYFIAVLFAIPAVLFSMVGWHLISKRKGPMSRKSKIVTAGFTVLLGCFIVVVLIPDFVAARYENNQNSCVNNLRQLQAGKMEWALETGATNGTLVTESDITPYIQLDSNGKIPKCQAGGTYIIGRVGEDVRCSIGTSNWPYRHVLSDTNDFTLWENFKGAYSILFGFRHVPKP
jgi:hypothetical protein